MEFPEDPTLGELERQGKLHPDLVLLYGRILGGNWRECRLSTALEAITHKDRHDETGATGTNRAA